MVVSFVFFIGNFKRPGWPQPESVEEKHRDIEKTIE